MTTVRKTPIRYRRGKAIPKLRHHDVLDLTTWPLGSKPRGRTIARCPHCGRKGEMTHYSAKTATGHGTTEYTHVLEFQTIFWMVRDNCTVRDEEPRG